jgi:colanic acid biosynthesis glycosyl transferase WcaI
MRIGVVTEYFDRTGSTPTVLHDLVTHLRARHPNVTFDVIASRNQYRGDELLARHESSDGVEITRLSTPKSNRASTMSRLAAGFVFTTAAFTELMRHKRHDVLLVVTNPPSLAMAASGVRRLRGTPYVYLIHDLYPDVANVLGVLPKTSAPSLLLHRLQKQWLRAATRVIVLGRCMRDYVRDNYGVPSEKVDVIPNWADSDRIVPADKSRFRETHSLSGVTVLYSGNFGMHQDFDVVLDAAKILQAKNAGVAFVLAGKGAQEAHIESRIANEGISNVRLFPLADQKDYSDLLAAGDIGLVTLARGAEGIGVPSKFYNILAAGRPTIAVVAPNSEVALVLHESDSGMQVNTGDAIGLAAAVERLAADPVERGRLGRNAREVLVRNYTLDQIGERFYESLSAAAGRSQPLTP